MFVLVAIIEVNIYYFDKNVFGIHDLSLQFGVMVAIHPLLLYSNRLRFLRELSLSSLPGCRPLIYCNRFLC